MTTQLHIRFAEDMPVATVEIVAPDFEVVDRIMLQKGGTRSLEVPSENTFLRIHLPAGKIVTLEDPGNPDRTIRLADVTSNLGQTARAMAKNKIALFGWSAEPMATTRLPDGFFLRTKNGNELTGYMVPSGRQWVRWDVKEPLFGGDFFLLGLRADPRIDCRIQVPGTATQVGALSTPRRSKRREITVHLNTGSPVASAALRYLHRGDLYSAQAMSEWVDDAYYSLSGARPDPFTATIAAYLLLRLKEYDALEKFIGRLEDEFPLLPDAPVIAAWWMIGKHVIGSEKHIASKLLAAVARGLPLYTEGLRLLLTGLDMVGGDDVQGARAQLLQDAGIIVWHAALTTTLHPTSAYAGSDADFRIELLLDEDFGAL